MSTKRAYEHEHKRFLHVFAANVRRLREAQDPTLTQTALSEAANLHRTELGRIENALTDPRLSTLVILADALGTTLDELAAGLPVPVERKPAPHRNQRPH